MQQFEVIITRIDNPSDIVVRGPYPSKYAAKKQKNLMENRYGLVLYTIKVRPVDEEAFSK